MPQALATVLVPWISNTLIAIGLPSLAFGAAVGTIALGASYLLLAGAAFLVSQAFAPQKPEAPKPEDGKFNLKQSVPPLVYVLGRVKKAGDYAFLEETQGVAFHVTVQAAHHIKGYVQHFLHDEAVTVSSGIVTSPSHFEDNVAIETRLGDNASTAYPNIIAYFPAIWGPDHRGDGLATTFLRVESVPAEDLQRVYPSGMPQLQAIIDGHDRLIDPRTGLAGYSTNLAIFRYWHLTHPVGGKLTRDDLYTPDWAHAADVCDQTVVNRSGGTEKRYHGGLWFRANNDPVQIGRLMDQAAELVLYERPDGKVGVHAGTFVAPDVRLTADDLISVNFDPNKRRSTNVLAVRGRYTDPAKGYNTADAAIYGVPYPSDDERTKTVENQAVQSHNHMARLQAIAYIRANAPRVKIVAHYEPARDVPYRRFVTVHYPPKMTEAVVEITGRPVLSLRALTYEFEGIVIPGELLYAFNSATQEGVPGSNIVPVERQEVPLPLGFDVTIQTEDVGGGASAAYARATFTGQSSTFQYELQWVPTAGGTTQSVMGAAGATTVRTGYLADGVQYKFRSRTWSVGASSAWTDYQVLTTTADPVAPGAVTGVAATGGTGQIAFSWTAPNSANYVGSRLYTNTTNTMTGATLRATEFGAPSSADGRTVTGLAADTYYGFVVAINGSGVEATPVPTGAVTVS
ncbi:hypothetical protein VW35_00770 [Devosia soli]|uniref:Fibronectin type-III domain-containing protein n=1 Tax=Devosia soli TaxID=361041 RepID=A0A0F5LEG1_9HYPH|nr:hypothetical protein [Devosia soli]KKB80776.1 hypothetical protein VW35_00770 [Devosia soli]